MRFGAFLKDLVRNFPGLLAVTTLLLIVEGVMGAASLFSVVAVIDLFMSPDLERASVVTRRAADVVRALGLPVGVPSLLGLFLALQVVQNGIAIAARHFIIRTRNAVVHEFVVGTFSRLLGARWQFFTSARQGTIVNTLLHEVNVAGDAFKLLALLGATLIQLVAYLAVPLYLSWQVTVVSIAVGGLLALPLLALGPLNYRLGLRATTSANRASGVIQESVTLAKVIFGFANQARSLADLRVAFTDQQRALNRSQSLRMAMPLLYEPFGMAVLVVTLLVAQRFAVPLSEIAALVWALQKVVTMLADVTARWNAIVNFLPSYHQVIALRARADAMAEPTGGRTYLGFHRDIVLDRVTFAYPEHPPTLSDVTLRIPKGRVVAVVGESGAGKSTLIDLLMGLHAPQGGRVLVDGVALTEVDLASYRRRIGYVPQESILFHASIRDNLRWAKPDATDAEIREACARANADEFVSRFPEGYDTVVGDRGVRLSGGQCQRLALARAILRRPDLLILDEATSSLDSQSERLIQNAVDSIARETTVVVVTHRLSTIANADVIHVLRDGRVVEAGTYADLLRANGTFSDMARLQFLEPATAATP